MKENRRYLLVLHSFAMLGQAVVGIFLPFLLAEAFGLDTVQVLLFWAAVMFTNGLLVYPLNRLATKHLGTAQMLQAGLVLQALFLCAPQFGESEFWITHLGEHPIYASNFYILALFPFYFSPLHE